MSDHTFLGGLTMVFHDQTAAHVVMSENSKRTEKDGSSMQPLDHLELWDLIN